MDKGIVNIDYFKELKEQIIDRELWDKERFFVFNHEAGTGKSRYTQQLLGEMTKTQENKVLYVQKFKKDNELVNTVERINYFADKNVAGYYCSEMRRQQKESIKKVQILCVTHQLYYQICKGNNLELIKGRDILIIDELPQLIQEVYITQDDVANLWVKFNRDGDGAGRKLAQALLDLLLEKSEKENDAMEYIDFRLGKYDSFRELFNMVRNSRDSYSKKEGEILDKVNMLLNQGFFIFQNSFISWDSKVELYKLRSNIILDANGDFEYKYNLSNQFKVIRQNKKYNYKDTSLFHYRIKTTKEELARSREIMHRKIISEINWDKINKVLFVTDIAGEQSLEKELLSYLRFYGNNLKEVEKNYNKEIAIDHFGNLIGKNNYRDFDSIVILKTPNYAYSSYVLDYDFLTRRFGDGVKVSPFLNQDVENIRISTVAGEFYQAIKRINRENEYLSQIYLFTDCVEAVEIVRSQLIDVQYYPTEINIQGRIYDITNRPKSKLNKLKEILMRYKESGIKEINKKTIKEELDIESPNLSKLLIEAKDFAVKNNIRISKGRGIFFD